ncbi:MBOAT family O-acyltransferase [Aquirufa sp.]|jgi:alginate O-acetyltransferase complex protein AlgI|uniref:MBOAT family O-acyltransferase n=1 Tax=Aquirufa sp. TaxID=2676249 RepID=UPI0037BE50BC
MSFNSINFAVFLPIVFLIYWSLAKNSIKFQNLLLLVSSYFFYAFWDWRFLFLLIFSTLLDFVSGIQIANTKSETSKKVWFWSSVIVNLSLLCVFKYYNFFTESFTQLLSSMGFHTNPWTLNVVLPIGISFYTFHGLSYVIDIYKKRINAETSFIDYSVFVSFFPLLVAGPIERATHLLPQIQNKRIFNYTKIIDGLRQILWGLFKKIVIADQCAEIANIVFNDFQNYSSLALISGAMFFSIQIYCDFSGYSDIALGTARLFGIELLKNFDFPYFSRDTAEFWRRWHISLSSWFKDYLYIPLGGSRVNNLVKVKNTFIIFFVSGLWHGANWTFIVWGLLNALYIMPSIIFQTNRKNLEIVAKGKLLPTLNEFFSMLVTFSLTVLAWIFFRSENIENAFYFISRIILNATFVQELDVNLDLISLILFFFILEWIGREEHFALAKIGLKWHKSIRYIFYFMIITSLFWFGGKDQQFIYFEF